MSAPMINNLFQCVKHKFGNFIPPSLRTLQVVQARCITAKDRKFYKNASISQTDGWYEVNLDTRKLRTPVGNLFRVPNESLAMAVATEWNCQEHIIKRHLMHLTTLCNTAIDNPSHRTKEDFITHIIHFLETDTVSFRFAEPEELFRRQEVEWGPVVDWVQHRYDIAVPYTTSLTAHLDLPQCTREKLEKHLMSHNDWSLVGYLYATEALKSLVLTLALLDKHISVERAVELSMLEQEFQAEKWGKVEWYHEVDKYEVQGRLAAAALFVHWSNEKITIKQKSVESNPSLW